MQPNDQILREIFERKIVESTCHRAKIVSFVLYFLVSTQTFKRLLHHLQGILPRLPQGSYLFIQHITHPIHRKKIEASDCEADIF